MTTKLTVFNNALSHFTNKIVTQGELTNLSNPEVRLLSDRYEAVRDRRLTLHNWRFAIVRDVLDKDPTLTTTTLTLSSIAVGTGVTGTASANTFNANHVTMYITNGAGLAIITGYTSPTIVTVEIITAFTSTTVNANTWRIYPQFEYNYVFTLPSDCLRVIELYDHPKESWTREKGLIFSNDIEIEIRYIRQVTDESLFSVFFADVLSYDLAIATQLPISGADEKLRSRLIKDRKRAISDAYWFNDIEGNERNMTWQQQISAGNYTWQEEGH